MKVSVLVPFAGDERARPDYIRSWTHRQQCGPGDFEVIALSTGADPAAEREIASYLRPGDRLLRAAAENGFYLYDIGARAARGELLLITEDHCLAEPSCVAEVIRHFESTADDAAFLRAGHINRTPLARLEELAYRRYLSQWLSPDHWDRVRIRGFAIRRPVYFAAGGLPGEYDHFAEAILAARLHAGGYRVGHAAAAGVRHVNSFTARTVIAHVRAFVRGECLFRERQDAEFCERYFQSVPEWSGRYFLSRRHSLSAAWAIVRTLWQQRRCGQWEALAPLLGELCLALATGLGGPRLRLAGPFLAVLGARARYVIRRDEQRRVEAFLDWWRALARYSRVRYLVDRRTEEDNPGPLSFRYDMAALSQRYLTGFHTRETHDGKTFRWTGPLAVLRVRVAPGDYRVAIDTGSLRGPDCSFGLGTFWNGHRIPREDIHVAQGRITFAVQRQQFARAAEQTLMLVCAPLRPARSGVPDQRLLGLPICSVEFAPLGRAQQPEVKAAA